jgi:hypothetical protein
MDNVRRAAVEMLMGNELEAIDYEQKGELAQADDIRQECRDKMLDGMTPEQFQETLLLARAAIGLMEAQLNGLQGGTHDR